MRQWPLPAEARPRRVIVERVRPQVDGGRFAIKRTVGERVVVTADVFTDGHDDVAAVVRYRLAEAPGRPQVPADLSWREVPMRHEGNDRWTASFDVDTLGRWEYTVEAWVDRFASWRVELSKKFAAAQDVTSELLEGAAMIRRAAGPAPPASVSAAGAALAPASDERRAWLLGRAFLLEGPDDQELKVAVALADTLAAAMAERADRSAATTFAPALSVAVERPRARFSTWYELFPRSAGPSAARSGTFDDVARRLPDIAAMGFDVLYLPPIHPVGRSFRKGANNRLTAGPDDPGSPWAIGGPEGGHTAVEPGLGTIEDFDRLVATAKRFGIELALDLAFQASPDHPWVREHPEWFRHRPDGTIKYAENPPKKYQDIYPIDFESPDWRALWGAAADVALFWIDHGVRAFRVDNPHTKPFRFWEWLIAEVRRRHPDTIFLAEAFTRPKPMCLLAKAGFSQSYTYFTWRNSAWELAEYFSALARGGVREYFRPNLFTNTPDILTEYLQRGGKPAFKVRLVLAATLGASYGIYSGFELCERRAVEGTEEYQDSEKYQRRPRDFDQPGNIKELIAQVNQVRRANPALQRDDTLRFHAADNPHLLCYSKSAPDGANRILVVVNVDPFRMQEGWVDVPADLGGGDGRGFVVHDLLADERFAWRPGRNFVRLVPDAQPAHVFRVEG
jgi:starch synthase (maltosyl-transferring)